MGLPTCLSSADPRVGGDSEIAFGDGAAGYLLCYIPVVPSAICVT